MQDAVGELSEHLLSEANARNVALLHEVDHRVKNNLQLIASLLVLQSRREDDPAVREALNTMLGRVNAVAVVHRRLFQDDPLSFDVAAFLRDLVEDRGGGQIVLRIDAEDAAVPTASAAPLALVVNELLTNAEKHAFADGGAGSIQVTLERENARLRIEIADEGVGLPANCIEGFGLGIVRLLCRQLKAEFEMSPANPGVSAVLTLPEAAS
jgi:two-component sensor histidine kinase